MIQSARNWNSLLHKLFEKHSFIQSQVDACVYIQDDDNKTLIVVWVLMNEAKELLKEWILKGPRTLVPGNPI